MRIALLVLLLSGCVMPVEQRKEAMESHIASFSPQCEKMGYQKDSDAFRDCQIRLYQALGYKPLLK